MPRDLPAAAAARNEATQITLFASVKTPTGTRVTVDWTSWLEALCSTPPVVAEKKAAPGWSPARFAGDQRGNAAVETVTALVLDVDEGGTLAQAVAAFGAWQGIVHTSYSHGATNDPNGRPCTPRTCFRVVLPLARPVTPTEHATLWAWAQQQARRHDVRLDPAPKAAGQFWFLPAVRPGATATYEAHPLAGPPLNPTEVLAPCLTTTEPPPSDPQRRAKPPTARDDLQRRGQRLCERHPPALQGQGGSLTLMKLAVALRRGLDLPLTTCCELLAAHYNPRCQPPWSPAEIAKKVRDAEQKGQKPFGYLLRPETQETARGAGVRPALRVVTPTRDEDRRQHPRRQPGERRTSAPLDPWHFHTTDTGNAERLVARHGADLRYCHPWQTWLVWDGQRWRTDHTAEIKRRAKDTALAIYAEAAAVQADRRHSEAQAHVRRDELSKWARRTEARERRAAMAELAQSEEGLPVLPDELDGNPWCLNVPNGTLDLRTGTLRQHRREDLLTKLAPVPYDPQATCPTWLAFLDTIFAGDAELIAFMQAFAGYALTGDTSEHVLVVAYGTGANGKSTFFDTLLALVGDYGWQAPPDLLVQQHSGHHPADEASLFRVRLAVCAETPGNRRLDTAKMKRLTGGEKVTARRMRENWWSFAPTHKLALGTNHKLLVDTTDHGTWRRPKLVPFAVTIPPEQRDKKLPKRLLAELPGILRWAIDGCLRWQRDGGLGEPHAMVDATQAWRDESDALGGFLTACCATEPRATMAAKELYAAYDAYCEANGDEPLRKQAFGQRLAERGLTTRKGAKGARLWRGLRLLTQVERADDPA